MPLEIGKDIFMSNFKNRSSFTRPNPSVEYSTDSKIEDVETIEEVDTTPDRKFAHTTSKYSLRLREKPNRTSNIIETLTPKTLIEVIDFYNGEWAKVSVDLYGKTLYGYVMLEYIELV